MSSRRARVRFSRPSWFTDVFALDMAYVLTITGVALLLRTWDLSVHPMGLHSDEASAGLDALDILDGKQLFPWTGRAIGQPAGPMYLMTPFVKVLGPTILAVRLPMAIVGALTVAFAFLAFRELFDRPTAYIGSMLLAFSSWLIFFNRTGFSVPTMPLTEMMSLYAVAFALNRRAPAWYVVAGVIVGAGVFGYYAYPFFGVGLAAFVLVHALVERPRPFALHIRNIVVMGLMALLAMQPMWPHFNTTYRDSRTAVVITSSDEYKSGDTSERIEIWSERVGEVLRSLTFDGSPDYTDGTGDWPALDPITASGAAAGVVLCLVLAVRRRRAAYLLPLLVIPPVLFSAVWAGGSIHRRALGALPFVVMALAIVLAYVFSALWQRGGIARSAGAIVLAILLGGYAYLNMNRYFDDYRGTGAMTITYTPQLTDAALFIKNLPPTTGVYFASDKWAADHDTMTYLMDGRRRDDGTLEDRSQQFGRMGETDVLTRWFEDIDRSRPSVFVLLGNYASDASEIMQFYPGATRLDDRDTAEDLAFVAVLVPPLP